MSLTFPLSSSSNNLMQVSAAFFSAFFKEDLVFNTQRSLLSILCDTQYSYNSGQVPVMDSGWTDFELSVSFLCIFYRDRKYIENP